MSDFLDGFDLAKLIAPISKAEFFERYWGRRCLFLHREAPDYYAGLLSLSDLDHVAAHAPHALRSVNAAAERGGSLDAKDVESLLARLQDGSSLIFDSLDRRLPALGRMGRMLTRELTFRTQSNIYLTPAHGKGFKAHMDDHDVFILQIQGTKQWRIEQRRRLIPAMRERPQLEEPEVCDPLTKFEIHPGDLIYIPKGYVHDAVSDAAPSLHVTLGLHGESWEQLLQALVRHAALRNPELHLSRPVGPLQDQIPAVAARLQEVLAGMADADHLRAALEQISDELVSRIPLDVSGQIHAVFGAPPLALDDRVAPRGELVTRLKREPDGLLVLYGGREIRFPAFLEASVRRCLEGEVCIRDLPGDLADTEKTVLVERLIQEGLIQRLTRTGASA